MYFGTPPKGVPQRKTSARSSVAGDGKTLSATGTTRAARMPARGLASATVLAAAIEVIADAVSLGLGLGCPWPRPLYLWL